jgi:plastocyanin domain-containing protein
MKKIYLIVIIVALILVFGIFLIKDSKITGASTGNSGSGSNSNKIQKVTLSISNHNYYPQTVRVKVNEPVRIYLDNSVSGCYRAFTIHELGVSKYLETPADYVEFTPIKTGTFQFACSMGMGTGTLIVE